MTTKVTIKNDGPDLLEIWFYNKERGFKEEKIILQVGQQHETNIWDDHLPVCMPRGHNTVTSSRADGDTHLFSIPQATW